MLPMLKSFRGIIIGECNRLHKEEMESSSRAAMDNKDTVYRLLYGTETMSLIIHLACNC